MFKLKFFNLLLGISNIVFFFQIIQGVAVLLYFGDLDLVCPFLSGESFISKTEIKVSVFITIIKKVHYLFYLFNNVNLVHIYKLSTKFIFIDQHF